LTLYIDPPNVAARGRLWSHLASDSSYDELHRFARTLGIPGRGFDRDHYDIPAERYDAVVSLGVTPVSSRELIALLKAAGLRRRKADALVPKKAGRSLVRAPRLQAGDRVAVVAPAGPVTASQLDAGLAVLRSWGLEPMEGEHVRGTHERLGYLAADDAARAEDLTAAWSDADVTAVLCARGGYGVQRMVDLLDWASLAQAGPKVLVGFSDVTALHQAFAARLGLATIHGPSVTSLATADQESRGHLRSMLFDPVPGTTLTPAPVRRLVGGHAQGVLVGGNLALLAADVGTGSSLPSAESIAVLEEVGEAPYRVDRMLTQLLRTGWFDGVRGIVVGALTGCGSPQDLHEVLVDRLGPLGVPTVLDAPFGHSERNLAFPLGVPADLDADAGTLVLRSAPLL
jgi:muramoyltetrapeptide carboxypeptidase